MKKLIALIIALLLCSSTAEAQEAGDGPMWYYAGCSGMGENIGSLTVAYFNPSEEILPFPTFMPGVVYIFSDGWPAYSKIFNYIGSSQCPLYKDCVVYMWRTTYEIPNPREEHPEYYVWGYVYGYEYQVLEIEPLQFSPGCNLIDQNKIYLPLVLQ